MPRPCAVEFLVGGYNNNAPREMPRACPAESHPGVYRSDGRETPRDKPVASHALWPKLILEERKSVSPWCFDLIANRNGGLVRCRVNTQDHLQRFARRCSSSARW